MLGCPKRSLLIMGHNLLQIFGPSFVKCYTFHIAKQQHIILSRTVQSKDCIAISRMRFAQAPPRQLGPRSYLLYSSASVHSQGKILVFPQLRQLWYSNCPPQQIFARRNFLWMKLSKNLTNLDAPAFSLPRHNSSTQWLAELLDELLRLLCLVALWRHCPASPPSLR
jgi:hypothetical protein